MTASIVQERQIFASTAATSVSLAFSASPSAGSTIHAVGTAASTSAPTMTFSDGANAYTAIGSTYDSADHQGLSHAYAPNIAGGATTVTVTFGASYTYNGLWIREIANVTASPLDGHNEGTSAASVTTYSISITNANQPALISAVGMTSQSGTNTATPASPMIADVIGFASQGESSHLRLTSASTTSVQYTTASADTISVLAAVFDESLSISLNPSTLPGGIVGTTYSETITASGGTAPYSFAVTAGSLPPGLTLSTAGVLSGTLRASGSYSFTITATDANSNTGSEAYSGVTIADYSSPPGLAFVILSGAKPNPGRRTVTIPQLSAGNLLEFSGNSTGTAPVPPGIGLHSDGTYDFPADYAGGPLWARMYDLATAQWTKWTWLPMPMLGPAPNAF